MNIVKRRKKVKRIVVLIAILLIITLLAGYSTSAVKPVAESLMISQANIMCTLAINNAVVSAMSEGGVDYSDLVEIMRNDNNEIIALRSDAVAINALQARVTGSVNQALSELPSSTIDIPIGTITGWEWLSGRGPSVHMKMIPSSYAYCTLEHLFDSAGINQTRHRIILHFEVNITALLTPFSASTQVSTSVCIAETVIVGTVPEMFAGF